MVVRVHRRVTDGAAGVVTAPDPTPKVRTFWIQASFRSGMT